MISIITPIYDIDKHLDDFLDFALHLSKDVKKAGKKAPVKEIILINNNPKVDLPNLVSFRPKIPLLNIIQNKKNIGYGRACNQGIKLAKGDKILIMNPDIRVGLSDLTELLKFMKKTPAAHIVSCKLVNVDGSLQYSCRTFPTLRALFASRISFFNRFFKKSVGTYLMAGYDHESPRKVDWVSGAFMLLQKKYYFDERYFMYFEDIDLCRTVEGVYYYPLVSTVHKAERASRRDALLFLSHALSMIKYFLKYVCKDIKRKEFFKGFESPIKITIEK